MPLPFIIAGLAVAGVCGYGIKKGIDAKNDLKEANRYNEKAKEIYDKAEIKLESKRIKTRDALKKLGNLKLEIYKNSLKDFVTVFDKIKKVEFEDNLPIEVLNYRDLNPININVKDIKSIKEGIKELEKISENLDKSLDEGSLALDTIQLGALGSSGLALTATSFMNPTLAWLAGSGAVSATISSISILGGVTSPIILAIGGIIAAKEAEKKKYEAYENYEKAKVAAEEVDVACEILNGIYKRVEEFIEVLKSLDNYLRDLIYKMKEIIDKSSNWEVYSDKEKILVMTTFSTAKTIKNICETPIIDNNGEVTVKSKKVLIKAKELSNKIEEI